MKVILNQSMAGPNGCFPAGATVDLPKESALHLLETHQATPAKGTAYQTASVTPPETAQAPALQEPATVEPEPEPEPETPAKVSKPGK